MANRKLAKGVEVQPFRALRYSTAQYGKDLSHLIAPPYDVIDAKQRRQLLDRHPDNIVSVDLPHVPPKTLGPQEAYDEAARVLTDRIRSKSYVYEGAPAIYLYQQQFSVDGKPYTRRMVIARVRLRDFSEGVILPHEETFGGPKEDRLALMKTTRCNLSSIFSLFRDDNVLNQLDQFTQREPDASGQMENVQERIWAVSDSHPIDLFRKTLEHEKIYIADGHHRYGTALQYRTWLEQQAGTPLPDDHPANFVMMTLASMDDPGCIILPYHRAIVGIDLDAVKVAWSTGTMPASPEDANLTLVDGSTGKTHSLKFTQRDRLTSLEPEQCAGWYQLDAAYLHRYLIDDLLQKYLGHRPDVRYTKSKDVALSTAKDEGGVALLVRPVPLEQLQAVSEAGGLMPQKATFFYPKVTTGFTINPLSE